MRIQKSRSEKESLRKQFSLFRGTISDMDYEARSQMIMDRIWRLPEIHSARIVHIYWPMISHHEVDTRYLIEILLATDKQIVLPVVVNFSRSPKDNPRLGHILYTGDAPMRANKWGIAEPQDGEIVPVEKLDVIVVPALGAGRNGFRLGHGYGFYDAFLSQTTAPRICPVYSECLVDKIPRESHDQAVSIVVTETDIIRPNTGVTSIR